MSAYEVSPSYIELLKTLVAFDTTSHLSNLEMIEYIVAYLKGLGVESTLVHNVEKTKANLYATIGPQGVSGVLLSGHTDVVPVKGQNWSSDPFELVEKKARLFGRGAADMKGFIAVVLSLVPKMLAAELKTPIHLAFSYDEEIGCVGVRRLISMMEGLAVKPGMCIIGEPTHMSLGVAHKGKLAARVNVRGLESHSSLPANGVNAVEYAAELIVFIRQLANQFAENGPFDESFSTPFSTLQTGVVTGGSAVNIVPNTCQFKFEIRNIPAQNIDSIYQQIQDFAKQKLEPRMRQENQLCTIDFDVLSDYPGLLTGADEKIVNFVKGLLGAPVVGTIAFGTEGGLFSERLGIPTVICGPGRIEQAHKPDEYVEMDQLKQSEAMIENLILALA